MGYVLKSPDCDDCLFSKYGFYNSVCVHCPNCVYSKNSQSSYVKEPDLVIPEFLKLETDGNGTSTG